MAKGEPSPTAQRISATRTLLDWLASASTELRGAAVFDADGSQLGATDGRDWQPLAERLWESADGPGLDPALQLHVAAEEGEVFAIRGKGCSVVATADRFTLASLMFCDLRAVIRDLEPPTPDPGR